MTIRTQARAATWVVAAVLAAAAIVPAHAQQLKKVKYAEVVRTIFYLPKYVALENGYFKQEGLDIDLTTAGGGDRGTAMLLAGQVDIALQGPETLIFVENSESPEKVKMFSAITTTDGLFLLSRQKVAAGDFKWDMLKGKRVMGWRPGSTPAVFLEHVMRKHGVEPKKDVTYITNIAIPARMGAWQANQADFAIFTEPDPSRIEAEGQGTVVASIGKEAGPADYTGFMATDSYIKKNPDIVQSFTNAVYRGQLWSAKADPTEAAKLVAGYFPGVSVELLASSIKRYRDLGIFKFDPVTTPDALNRLQDIMIEGDVLKADKKVKYERVVITTFAEKAKATIR
jgi:NitT/TauT family transport system substrate-binding protein